MYLNVNSNDIYSKGELTNNNLQHKVVPCCIYLASKMHGKHQSKRTVVKVAWSLLYKKEPPLDVSSPIYNRVKGDLVKYKPMVLAAADYQSKYVHPHFYVKAALKGIKG